MRLLQSLLVGIACFSYLIPQALWAEESTEARRLTAQAEGMLWLGLAEHGRVREFEAALELVGQADELLAGAEVPDTDRMKLALKIGTLREHLDLNLERSRRRFYGAYPLARLVVPVSGSSRQVDITETLRADSDNEAVREAAERVVVDIIRLQYPHAVFRSEPQNRAFENEAMRVFAVANRPFAHSGAELVEALTQEESAAYYRGDFDRGVIARVMQALGAAKLLVLTIHQEVELPDGALIVLEGVFYETGFDRPTDSFAHMGFSRGRRQQIRWMVLAHLILFAVALLVAAWTPWNPKAPWPVIQRIAMGAALFFVGRLFAPLAVLVLRRVIPHPDATAAGSWWWPALLGLVVILGAGLVAWMAQARSSRIVPGSRTSRAVGMIHVLAALGACAYFIEPLLLLEPERGLAVLVPLVLASVALAGLTGYAIRTGPPVPLYFVLGTVLVAPFVGMALLAMRPGLLWWTVVASGVLCALAAARHRYAVEHGLEEAQPDEDEAERRDLERLEELGRDFEKKLPI
jgi:MFS family permease